MSNAGSGPRAARQQTLFSYFDVNHDGVIDVSDFVAITQRASSFLPVGAPPAEEVLHAARLRFSWFRKADTDADRRVSADEWMAHCAKEFAGEGLSGEAEAFARVLPHARHRSRRRDRFRRLRPRAPRLRAQPHARGALRGLSRARREREQPGHAARVSRRLHALRRERRRRSSRSPRRLKQTATHASLGGRGAGPWRDGASAPALRCSRRRRRASARAHGVSRPSSAAVRRADRPCLAPELHCPRCGALRSAPSLRTSQTPSPEGV